MHSMSHSPLSPTCLWNQTKEMHDMAGPPTLQRVPLVAAGGVSEKAEKDEMVQVFMVVRCYHCETFQVQQVKKVNKWICKSCNEKQSLIKVYGKGKAADCRKHVQKLNMMRGEKEQAEIHAHLSSNHPPEIHAHLSSNHPPEDYASTFTVEDEQTTGEENSDHPVVVAGKTSGKSKWTTFIEIHDSDDEGENNEKMFTTDTETFTQARKLVKRSESDRVRPHHLSKANRSTLPVRPRGGNERGEKVVPYSSFSQEMELLLDDCTPRLSASKSLHTLHHERYRKLEEPAPHTDAFSQSMFDLSSPHSHKEDMETIRKDISRYTRPLDSNKTTPTDQIIPKTSSRWSQFMHEDDESGDDGEGGEGGRRTHLLTGKSTVAQFTMIQDSH